MDEDMAAKISATLKSEVDNPSSKQTANDDDDFYGDLTTTNKEVDPHSAMSLNSFSALLRTQVESKPLNYFISTKSYICV